MCATTSRHRCLRCFLFTFSFLVMLACAALSATFLATYFVSEGATILRNQTEPSLPQPEALTNELVSVNVTTKVTVDTRSWADWIVEDHLTTDCVIGKWIVNIGYLFNVCPIDKKASADLVDPETSLPSDQSKIDRKDYVQCSRQVILYGGYGALAPTVLTFLSLVSLCALCMCPLLSLAMVYVIIATGLLAIMLYYKSSVILNLAGPILIMFIISITVLLLLGFFHILLYILVSCEQKHAGAGDDKGAPASGGEDEDDIDDPKRPLYENGYSPANKNDFEERIKGFKYIDDDMSYILRKA